MARSGGKRCSSRSAPRTPLAPRSSQGGGASRGYCLESSHLPSLHAPAGYLELKELSFEARLEAPRDPARRAAILGEQSVPILPGTMENGVAFAELNFDQIFLFDEARDYEPTKQSFAARARAKGMDPHAFLYDALTAGSGERFAVMYFTNYADHNLDARCAKCSFTRRPSRAFPTLEPMSP